MINRLNRAWAFILALICMFLMVIIIQYFFKWEFFAGHIKWNFEKKNNNIFISKKLAALEGKTHKNILLIGGSTSRELTSHDKLINEELSKECGNEYSFTNVGSSSQNLITAWSIYDSVKKSNIDLVVVGMNYYRFAENRNKVKKTLGQKLRLPFIPISNEFLKMALPWGQHLSLPNIYQQMLSLFEFKNFFKGVDWQAQTALPASPNESEYIGYSNFYLKPSSDPLLKLKRARKFTALRVPEILDSGQESVALWKKFIEHMKLNGTEVTLLVLPMDSVMNEVRVLLDPLFNDLLKELKKSGANIVDWRDSSHVTNIDFYDQQHLLPRGRAKLFKPFVDLLSSQVQSCKKRKRVM